MSKAKDASGIHALLQTMGANFSARASSMVLLQFTALSTLHFFADQIKMAVVKTTTTTILLLVVVLIFSILAARRSSREPFKNLCQPSTIRGGEASIVFGTRVGATSEKVLRCPDGYTVTRMDVHRAMDGDSVAGISVFCGKASATCDEEFDGGSVATQLIAPMAQPSSLILRVDETRDMSWKVLFPLSRVNEDPAKDQEADWVGIKTINAVDNEASLGAAIRFAPQCNDSAKALQPYKIREVKSSSTKAVRVFYDKWFVKGFQFVYVLPDGL
jgi:hypothetical protein